MAQGVLAGRYDDATQPPADSRAARRGGIYAERVTPAGVRVGTAFSALAREAGLSPAQLALLWVKDQPGVTAPIFGARTVAQLDEAIPVMELRLSDDLRSACDALVPPGSAVVNFHNSAAWMRMQLTV
jgi:aryl-alcohol dehydrogenase-like predicted oxidoreductase